VATFAKLSLKPAGERLGNRGGVRDRRRRDQDDLGRRELGSLGVDQHLRRKRGDQHAAVNQIAAQAADQHALEVAELGHVDADIIIRRSLSRPEQRQLTGGQV
jgi:hypothetical protein